ncbi:hypothetical protein ACFL6S_29830 [Candidatus Poribacteria bacterium]
MTPKDRKTLRDLAKRYLDICNTSEQQERRKRWRSHNSFKGDRPLIYVRAFAWREMPQSKCQCEDSLARGYENFFRNHLFWDTFNDDSIFEPWVTVRAAHKHAGWGIGAKRISPGVSGGACKFDYPIKELDDIKKLQALRHEIDEEKTAANVQRVHDVMGDIITINVDRGPAHRMWSADLSTNLGSLRGIENFMMDMMDHPQWLHQMVSFMSDSVLRAHDQAEEAGDWGLCAHQNQAMTYAEELEDPAANHNGVKRGQLWGYMAAQEFALVSPAMHDEFLLQYQIPILSKFGLAAYGCCEDLTQKIDILRQIPNLRRIAVSPFADVARCAEQIGRDYVLSYRPSPADMVSYGYDPDRIRKILKPDLEAAKHCHVDITLKDVETVQSDPDRVHNWVKITRQVIDEVYG